MYQKSYEIIARESPLNYRNIEREAIIGAIAALQNGLHKGPESIETVKAISLLQNIWSILLVDLLSDDNKLPDDLRAKLISVGLWVQKELDKLRTGETINFNAIIDINVIIADGLS